MALVWWNDSQETDKIQNPGVHWNLGAGKNQVSKQTRCVMRVKGRTPGTHTSSEVETVCGQSCEHPGTVNSKIGISRISSGLSDQMSGGTEASAF